MSFALLQKSVGYLLAGVGLLALSFGGELSTLALIVLSVGFVVSWFVEGELIERPLWARGWNAFLLVAMAAQVVRAVAGGAGWLGYAMEFAGLLTISRLFNRRSAADYQQIAMLAFMHMIAATVLTNDLGYAGLFVVFVIATPWALTLAHMRFEVERNYPKQSTEEGGSDVSRVLSSKRLVGPRFLLWTALLSLPMLAMTLGIFLIFPRVGLGFVGLGQQRGQHVAGFGNKVELGGFGVIRDDPTVVVRVTPNRRLSSLEETIYLRLRGTAFDHYDGRRWTRSDGLGLKLSPISSYYSLRRMPKPKGDIELQIVLDRLDEAVLFLAPGTVGFRIVERDPTAMRDRTRITRHHGLDLRYQSPEDMGIVYHLTVSTNKKDLDIPVARDMDDDRYLQLPPNHERVAQLARKVTEGLTDPVAIANKLSSYLRSDGGFEYTLVQPDVGDKQPLDVFLFEAKRGHCEYFATALAIMLRSLGIPARNVTGFVGGEFNRFGGYFAVRQADAHSWVEAHVPERGWITLDPTPSSRNAFAPEMLLRDLSDLMDAARAYWMLNVVGYDLRTQIQGLRQMASFFRSFSLPSFGFGKKNGAQGPVNDKSGSTSDTSSGSMLVAGLSLVALVVAAVFALRALKKRRGKRVISVSAREAQELYRVLEKVLAQKGRARPPHVTPEAHARALRESGFAAAGAVEQVTELYLQARYGALDMPRERMTDLRRRIDDVKRAA